MLLLSLFLNDNTQPSHIPSLKPPRSSVDVASTKAPISTLNHMKKKDFKICEVTYVLCTWQLTINFLMWHGILGFICPKIIRELSMCLIVAHGLPLATFL